MKVTYRFPLNRPLDVDDHWPVPLLGGTCHLIENDGLVTAIQFTKGGLPTDLAFSIIETPDEFSKATITGNDTLLPVVRDHIKRAFSFLQCFFDADVIADEVEITHEPESAEEAAVIKIPKFSMGKKEQGPLDLTYDFVTRALMAASDHDAPEFISALARMSREALIAGRYIDSFRFSFLLLESLFGGGKFKAHQLKGQFAASSSLKAAIQKSVAEWVDPPDIKPSPTLALIRAQTTTPDEIASHLVDMRGHYFHGNLLKPGAWHPAKQEEANALATLCVSIVHVIAADAALPMFADAYASKHFDDAAKAGALVVMKVTMIYRMPDDGDMLRTETLNAQMPGTKPTTRTAMEIAWRSIENFRNRLPSGRLHSLEATDPTDGKQLFFVRFSTEPDGPIAGERTRKNQADAPQSKS